jgi:hypothetical protein
VNTAVHHEEFHHRGAEKRQMGGRGDGAAR